jgi:hypothetical protein
MYSFRSDAGKVAWLALFALACQLIFSFGHVHLGKRVGNAWTVVLAAPNNSVDRHSSPSPQHRKDPTVHGFCAICANVGLAGALVIPVSASILPQDLIRVRLPTSQVDTEPRSIAHLLFSAGGPPAA